MTDSSDYTANPNYLQDHKRLVRAGYNVIAPDYLAARTTGSADVNLLERFMAMLAPGALVLDAGCGAGVPVTRLLQQRFRVIGVDFAETQLRLAKRLVPQADYICQDLTALGFARNSFDALCSYYAIIHVPREEHEALFRRIYGLLKPGGLALLCLGAQDLPSGFEDDYFGSRMHWSHFDARTNREMLEAAGLQIVWSELVPDSHPSGGKHLFTLTQKMT
ncbi:MAG TPA: class I SAM-dependent methyltransferase [Candidatus Binatia bacterium]|nr:class I SAM-dependent methyltransferase [Candidatus Binatia bacterium]